MENEEKSCDENVKFQVYQNLSSKDKEHSGQQNQTNN